MAGDPFKLDTGNPDTNATTSIGEPAPIKSTIPKKSALLSKKKPAVSIEKTDQIAKNLGFSSRENTHFADSETTQGCKTRRKPGRKRIEPQGRVLISGPERVLERFKAQSEARGITYWEYIEMLMVTTEK